MLAQHFLLISTVYLLAGCATNVNELPPSPDSPASPSARESVRSTSRTVLVTDATTRAINQQFRETADKKGQSDMKMDHDMGGMNMGKPAASPSPTAKTTAPMQVDYTCVMHPEVHREKPGDCPICGMKLIQRKN